MEEYSDEIILLAACVVTASFLADASFASIGFLLSVSLVCLCHATGFPCRIIAQVVFLVCALVLAPALSFLPLCAYAMLHERYWAVRIAWVIPLVSAVLFGTVPAVQCAAVALVCAASVLMGVKDARTRVERTGLQFAFDDLRERNLKLLSERAEHTAADEGTTGKGARATDVRSRTPDPFCDLTEREYAIAKLVAEGMDNREISSALFLSEGTVRNHISSILSKLELGNRTQIAVMYYKG